MCLNQHAIMATVAASGAKPSHEAEQTNETADLVRKLLSLINADCSYPEWFQILCAVYDVVGDEDIAEDIADDWSMSAPESYDPRVFRKTWKTVTRYKPDDTIYTISDLIVLAKRDQPAEYDAMFPSAQEDDAIFGSDDFFDFYKGVIMQMPEDQRTYAVVKSAFEKQYFHLRHGGDTYGCYMRDSGGKLFFQPYCESLLKAQNKNVYYWSKDLQGGKPKRQLFVTEWVGDTYKRYYNRRDFLPPPMKCPKKVLNTFTGLSAALLPASGKQQVTDEDVAPFIAHMNLIAGGDSRSCAYLLNWFAQILQEPGKLSGTYVIFGGREGTGKSFAVNFIGEKLIGGQFFYKTDRAGQDVFSRFANGHVDKLLLNFEGVSQLNAHQDNLKDLVTSTETQFERKGAMSETVHAFNRVVITTNSRFPLIVEPSDRRVVAVWASDDKCNNREYFAQLTAWCDSPVNVRLVYEYLMARPIADVDFVADRPITPWFKDIKGRSLKSTQQFLLALADKHEHEEVTDILSADLMTQYLHWCGENNQRSTITATALGLDVHTAGGENIVIGKQRLRGFRLVWNTILENINP